MFAQQCKKFRLDKGLSHTFDRLSGWCVFGCGNRDDGRIVTGMGAVIEYGPKYTSQELAQIKANVERVIAERTPARAGR